MKLSTLDGIPVVVRGDQDTGWEAASIAEAGADVYPTMRSVLDDWDAFGRWIASAPLVFTPVSLPSLGAPVPDPSQVLGFGLNYVSHLEEAGRPTSRDETQPLAFTKFPSSLTSAYGDVELHGDSNDWEVELVAVIGAHADRVRVEDALGLVAGYMLGQDISDRAVQRAGQLSLGKSFRTYAPCGPFLVTPDELGDPQDLGMKCWVNDELVQDSTTADMLYSTAELIALASAIITLRPGDLVFTGTAAGVGVFRQPPRFLKAGDVIHSEIEGLGRMRNVCRNAAPSPEPLAEMWLPPLA